VFIAEAIGVFLVGYGIWFTNKGVQMALGIGRGWWRPTKGKKRYPYPIAGVMLGICFTVLGLRFALNSIWVHVQILSYVGGALFVVVLVIGVVQPRFLHPRWYGRLEDRYGREGVAHLKQAAHQLEDEQWIEVCSTEEAFDHWARQAMFGWKPTQSPGRASGQRSGRAHEKARRSRRGYQKSRDRDTHK
jgi:hypothetical protein